MRKGFSLIELSIVLALVGLLTGGILAGRSLIRASELRSVIADLTRYRAALVTFRDKYFFLPGDLNIATSYWGDDNTLCPDAAITNGTPGTCNGNGDGHIDQTGEGPRAWQQLNLAGLIETKYTGSGSQSNPGTVNPASKVQGAGFALFYSDIVGTAATNPTSNRFIFGSPDATVSSMNNAGLRPEETWNIDRKIDDGVAITGKLYGVGGMFVADGTCTDLNSNYDLTNKGIACTFTYDIQ